jgi:cell division protein FtsB
MDQTHLNAQATSAFSTVNSQELQSLRTTNQTLEKKLEQLHNEMLKDRKRLNDAEI